MSEIADLPTKPLPRVQLTALLRDALVAQGDDPDLYCDYFAEWKSWGPSGEFSDWYFGKDGYYRKPVRNHKQVLRHVHLPPVTDKKKAATWDWQAKKGLLKASNTALVYAQDPHHGFLLIYIAREPDGHALSDMLTDATRKLMNDFCDVAEAFIHDGSILI